MITKALLEAACVLGAADGELQLNARNWTGSLEIVSDGNRADQPGVSVHFLAGVPCVAGADRTVAPDSDHVQIRGSASDWQQLLASTPSPPYTDPFGARFVGMSVTGDVSSPTRHLAIRRFVELLRHAANGTDASPVVASTTARHGSFDAATGRYVHLLIDGLDHRVYFEEAGQGIALLCQHTAGADGRQWRHLLEDPRVTSRFRVIAYDLPYHGRSLPPEGRAWWAQAYVLTTESAMAVPIGLAEVLGLDRPVFMGSSVGGMLALDLARFHPDRFRAVIACEAALKLGPDQQGVPEEAHLSMDVSTDPALHAASMMSWMGASAPERYRQETRLHYAQGAPGVFAGDIHYFANDHDLRADAHLIDTGRCAVHLLTGEYDFVTLAASAEAAQAIPGATYAVMPGMGHFPMSEDPERFAEHVLPILTSIAERRPVVLASPDRKEVQR